MVKLSIIIPYYQTYELTKQLLEVLIPQLTDETQVLFIDDGCHEDRFDVYKDKIDITHLKQNYGGAYACNVGIKNAKGQYIGFIDSDDMIDKDYIKTLIETINKRDEDAIFFQWQDIANGVIVKHPNNYAPWKAIYKNKIIPLFEEGVRFSYDVPFYNKLNAKPYTRYDIEKVLYYYNSQRPGNLTSIKEKVRRSEMIRCEVIRQFAYGNFDQLVDLTRGSNQNKKGELYVGDTFKCDKQIAEYLMGKNDKNITVIKVIEVEPEKEQVEDPQQQADQSYFDDTPIKTTKKKSTKKSK